MKFVAIKVLQDAMTRPDMCLGYSGLERAARAHADIILCAWSGGTASVAQVEMVRQAQQGGALVGSWDSWRPSGIERHPTGLLPLSKRPWKVSLDGPGSYQGARLGLVGVPYPQSLPDLERHRQARGLPGIPQAGAGFLHPVLPRHPGIVRRLGHRLDGSGAAPYAHE